MKSIHWERTDGRRMSANVVAYSARLIFNKHQLTGDDYVSYTCVAETFSGDQVRKEHVLGEQPTAGAGSAVGARPVSVRIVAIAKDVREGGRIELECETGN